MHGWLDRQHHNNEKTEIERKIEGNYFNPPCPAVTNRHTGFHYLARYSFGTKICMFNYEEQAVGWYRLDRMFNNLYYVLHRFFSFRQFVHSTHFVRPIIAKTEAGKLHLRGTCRITQLQQHIERPLTSTV